MLDHIGIAISDIRRSESFYAAALAPLGIAKIFEYAPDKTDSGGTCGLPLPLDVESAELYVTIHHDEYNARHLRLDGTTIREDIRVALYGASA